MTSRFYTVEASGLPGDLDDAEFRHALATAVLEHTDAAGVAVVSQPAAGDRHMTRDTLLFLRDLLTRQTLQVGADDFRPVANQVLAALDELDQELNPKDHP